MTRVKTKQQAVERLYRAAVDRGLWSLTSAKVASLLGWPKSLVFYHFGTVTNVKQTVVDEAIARNYLPILMDARYTPGVVLPAGVQKKIQEKVATWNS